MKFIKTRKGFHKI